MALKDRRRTVPNPQVKREPELPSSSPPRRDNVSRKPAPPSTNSLYTATSVAGSMGYPLRSDAPPPTDFTAGDQEPMLREVRARTMAAPQAVASPDDSFFHSSFQDIGRKLKECNDTLGELQQLGVSHDVQLPELVLVGDQSAGKSSLMSGLANLDLPRSEGTCTRCPLHIRVSRNTQWSCRVWLRKEYEYKPPEGDIHESQVTDDDPFFPWKKRKHDYVHEFKIMHDKSEIEQVLRWAQIAILNDDKDPSLFVPGSGSIAANVPIGRAAEDTVAKFSPNIVALEIKGPGLPDLSFYDMPGIFQNPADVKDDYLVCVVRNLSKAYIQHPSAIIMCSMPMNSDAENSSTFNLTRRLGASPRTIGVLTKADLLPLGGNHDQWLDIMKGLTHHTGLGYFITSRPKDKDLEELVAWEERIFEDQSSGSWPSDFHAFVDRCGVEKLKSFLSQRLGEAFAKSLPTIKRKLRNQLEAVNKQLASLPELPENVEMEIQTRLITFADLARKELDDFVRTIGPLPQNFATCLLEMKPKITLRDKTDIPIHEISDDESDATSVAPTPKRRQGQSSFTTPSNKRQRTDVLSSGAIPINLHGQSKPEDSTNGNISPAPSQPPTGPRKTQLPEPFSQFSKTGSGFRTLRGVREEVEAKMKAGMPAVIPAEVYEDLALEAIKPWDKVTDVYLRHTMQELQRRLDSALLESMGTFKKRFIFTESRKHLRKCLEQHKMEIEDSLTLLYKDESQRLLTFNDEAFRQYRESEAITLTRFRHMMRMQAAGLLVPGKQFIPWESLSLEKRAQETKQREAEAAKLGPDSFAREVEVVAYVRGYYRLAAHRFGDNVSQHILCRMIPSIRLQLARYLEHELGVRAPDAIGVYERLMDEDEATAAKRENLKSDKEKFRRALASIEGLETTVLPGEESSIATNSFAMSFTDDRATQDTQMTDIAASDEV